MTRSESAAKFFSLRLRPWGLVTACGGILSTATVLAFFGNVWWFLDLFSHFRVQFFLGLSVIALALVFRRRYKAPAFFGMVALVNLCTIVPLYLGEQPRPTEASRSYRGLLINVNTESGDPDQVAQAISQLDPERCGTGGSQRPMAVRALCRPEGVPLFGGDAAGGQFRHRTLQQIPTGPE